MYRLFNRSNFIFTVLLFLTEDSRFFVGFKLQFTTQGDMILAANGNEEICSKNHFFCSLI